MQNSVVGQAMDIAIIRSAAAYHPWRPAVAKLFRKAFRKPFPEDLWDLYYRDNPFGEVLAALAIAGDQVVGHHALIPQVLSRSNGEAVRYLLSISLMTDPDYRNVFLKLVSASHKAALESGAGFMLSFANANGAPPLRRLFGHQPMLETPLLNWTPRDQKAHEPVSISPAEIRSDSEELTYPSSSQYWRWRTSLNGARAVRLNDRTTLVYKVSGGLLTVLDLESADRQAARADLEALALHHDASRFRVAGYHARLIETFDGELSSHENYILSFNARKLAGDVPAIRFSLLLSDVF